jgi:hypothetical protein
MKPYAMLEMDSPGTAPLLLDSTVPFSQLRLENEIEHEDDLVVEEIGEIAGPVLIPGPAVPSIVYFSGHGQTFREDFLLRRRYYVKDLASTALARQKLVFISACYDHGTILLRSGRKSDLSSLRAAQTAVLKLGAPKRLTDDALSLITEAHSAGVSLPPAQLTGDNEIMFYARKGRAYLDLGVNGDGTYSFFCRDSAGNEYVTDDDLNITAGLDPNVRRVVRDDLS